MIGYKHVSTIVHDRWLEAVENPDMARWMSLAQLAATLADAIESDNVDNILAASMRGISAAAMERMLAMQPEEA